MPSKITLLRYEDCTKEEKLVIALRRVVELYYGVNQIGAGFILRQAEELLNAEGWAYPLDKH